MNLEQLAQFVKDATKTNETVTIPPLEKWQPQRKYILDLTIKANGQWWYQGVKISRQALINLFATVLWAEQDTAKNNGKPTYFLKTPVEQAQIMVEDAPLFVNDVGIIHKDGVHWLQCTTTTGDVFLIDDEHQPFFTEHDGQIKPYINVRNGLIGLIMRPVFYHLIQLGELNEIGENTVLTLNSGGGIYQLTI